MNAAPLQLVLTFDAEADVFDGSFATAGSEIPQWRGIEEGIPLLREILEARAARSTWFVRTDREIAAWHGDAAHLLRRHEGLWRRFAAAGDEIGFHPHFTRRAHADASGATHQAEIESALAAVRAAGFSPRVSRMGEAHASNAIMATLSALGMAADSTAMPGRVRRDAERSLDWQGTPVEPYQPSLADYRLPGDPAHPLLEIPMSMVPVQAEYDATPFPRYVDLSFRHAALREGLAKHLRTADTLVTITHPSTVIAGVTSRRHGLLSFQIAEFQRNLDFIFDECVRLGRPVESITLGECAQRHAAALLS